MHAFILAGGFATRLWPLTEKRAKPLLPLAGKPIITRIVEQLPKDMPVTVSTNAAFAKGFMAWQAAQGERPIEIIIERTTKDEEKLGALGAVAQWVTQSPMNDDVLLLTGDNSFGFSFETFLRSYRPGRALLAAHDIGERNQARAFGTVILGEDGATVTGFEEKPREPVTSLVSTGCSILPRGTLPVLTVFAKNHPDNVGGIFEEFLHRQLPIDVFIFSEPWFDIGSFAAYLDATTSLVGENVLLGEGATLKDTVCEGSVVIGKGSRVTGSVLRDTVVFEGCAIDDCILERCVLDDACTLTRADLAGKMLREGTVLKDPLP